MPHRPTVALLLALAFHAVASSATPVRYALRYDAASRSMSVRVCVPDAAASLRFVADRAAARYVDSLVREHAPPPAYESGVWSASDWHAGECLAYRAALGRIVDAGGRGGAKHGDAIVVDPDLWLLRLDDADAREPAEADVALPAGYALSTPWHPLESGAATQRFAIPSTPKDWLARIAIGTLASEDIALAGGLLRVSFLGGIDAAQRGTLDAWLRRVGRATLSAYGKLPLADVQVLIVPARGGTDPVEFGQSSRGQGHALTLFLDPAETAAALDRDWVAVHELSHLFHPYLGDKGSWLAEGLATYYQNVLRARAGLLTPDEAWQQIDAGFARGRAATRPRGDVPLDASGERPNFMRLYWSGTAFWLEVDAELRRTSANALDVDEALRRFDACCLPSYRAWAPHEFVAKLDALIGSDVFRKHFADYATRRDFPDLAPLYRELGLRRNGSGILADDKAPLAAVRRAIMQAEPPR